MPLNGACSLASDARCKCPKRDRRSSLRFRFLLSFSAFFICVIVSFRQQQLFFLHSICSPLVVFPPRYISYSFYCAAARLWVGRAQWGAAASVPGNQSATQREKQLALGQPSRVHWPGRVRGLVLTVSVNRRACVRPAVAPACVVPPCAWLADARQRSPPPAPPLHSLHAHHRHSRSQLCSSASCRAPRRHWGVSTRQLMIIHFHFYPHIAAAIPS